MRPNPPVRSDYRAFRSISTRWMDNDVYGHVNNAIYYSFFDTVVSGWLVEHGIVDYERGQTIGLAVDSQCSYYAPIAFPDQITGGMCVRRIGTSSVKYAVGIFRKDEDQAAASGTFTHVYVDRETRRPVPLPQETRSILETVLIAGT